MSLSLELLARSALAQIHPVLLADPREPDNIQYAFGIIPKKVPKSLQAKAVFARCSVFIAGFTDQMSGHCLIMADRRNSELHTGAAAFEGIDNSAWLPATYEAIEILLNHLKRDFTDFIGTSHADVAVETLKDRRVTIIKEVHEKLAAARKSYEALTPELKAQISASFISLVDAVLKSNRLRKKCTCPACGNDAVISGEIVSRTLARIDEDSGSIKREARILPNLLYCPFCKLGLKGYQELKTAQLGVIYTIEEYEDPVAFFGIEPEAYVDVDELVRNYMADAYEGGYENE
jgi:hypothetical protein